MELNWIDQIDFMSLLKKNSKEYKTENDTSNNTDISNINFSLDNEQILKEIDNIFNIKHIEKCNTLILLKYQNLLISYLNKSIQNTSIKKDFMLQILNWILLSSKILSNKLNLEITSHNEELLKSDKILRSSYKFCNFKHKCNYNYDTKKKGCYADHYVHNSIYADIEVLIKWTNMFNITHSKELIKCVNTISFVIKHQYEELHNLCMYVKNESDYEKYHIIKKH